MSAAAKVDYPSCWLCGEVNGPIKPDCQTPARNSLANYVHVMKPVEREKLGDDIHRPACGTCKARMHMRDKRARARIA